MVEEEIEVSFAGDALQIVPDPTDPAENTLIVDRTNFNLLERVEIDLSGTPSSMVAGTRQRTDSPIFGINNRTAGTSIVNPNVIMKASNDGGPVPDGVVAFTCADDELQALPRGPGGDPRGSFGPAVWNPDAQWKPDDGALGTFDQYVFGTGAQARSNLVPPEYPYMLVHFAAGDPAVALCPPPIPGETEPPTTVKRWFIDQKEDSLNDYGRKFYLTEVNEQYNQENLQAVLEFDGYHAYGFAGRANSLDGATIVDLDVLTTYLQGQTDETTHLIDGAADAWVDHLRTHPEFDNVADDYPAEADAEFFLDKAGLDNVLTGAPQLFRLDEPSQFLPYTWVLAVPCGFLNFPPNHPVLDYDGPLPLHEFFGDADGADPITDIGTEHEDWAPEPRYADYGHSLVRFWDVTNPAAAVEMSVGGSPLEIIGDDPEECAYGPIETWEPQDQSDRLFLFVPDLGGGLEVYEWGEMDQASGDQPEFASWDGTDSVSDGLPNSTWSIVIDPISDSPPHARVYAAVQRVGVQVLDFFPDQPPAGRLTPLKVVQTPGELQWIELRVDSSGARSIVLTDVGGGIRILESGQ